MIESENERQLRVVLKNYDAKRVECENLEKENARLKQELAQQKVLYRNMLNRYVGKGLEKEGNKDWKEKYDKLREKYDTKNEKYQLLANENSKVRQLLYSLRGALCSAYTKADDCCLAIGISHDAGVEPPKKEEPVKKISVKEDCFIRYIRELVDFYKKTKTLNGISVTAAKYGIRSITKVQFFEFGLQQDEPLTDERILEIYEKVKQR